MLVKHNVTGNKSRALLLTVFVLTRRRGHEQFTIRRAASAVQDGMARLAKQAYRSFGRERCLDRRPEAGLGHSGAV